MLASGVRLVEQYAKRPRWRLRSETLGIGLLAAMLGALMLAVGPPGNDLAAHVHLTEIFAAHGYSIWDNSWYAGRYSLVTYSLLYYPLAVAVGIRTLAALSVGVAAFAFAVLVQRRWGDRAAWASRSFAVVLAAFMQTGALPFALGAALGLLGLCALQARRWVVFGLLVIGTLAASPLAFLFVGLAVVAIACGERPGSRWTLTALGIVGAVGLIELLLNLLFASDGYDPFSMHSLLPALAFGGALIAYTWRVPGARVLTMIGALYCVSCLLIFAVHSNIGEGITRFRVVALPLVILAGSLRAWRPRALIVVLVASVGWFSVEPDVSSLTVGIRDHSSEAAYWQPAIAFLHAHSNPSFRTEVVDTAHHWGAAYLPSAGLPIVRGWFRQDDFPLDQTLYKPLSAPAYRRWLRGFGVAYVVLTDAKPDASTVREAALLRGGRSGLRRVLLTPHLAVFAVPAAGGIVVGPGRPWVRSVGRLSIDLMAPQPGNLRLAVHSSPYWHTTSGCLAEGPDGLLRLRVARAGAVGLHFRVDPAALAWALTHSRQDFRPCARPDQGAAP